MAALIGTRRPGSWRRSASVSSEGRIVASRIPFGAIGVASTLAYVALYALLREVMSAGAANATALLATALANTAANRRLTFHVRGPEGFAADMAAGLLALGVALLITSVSLAALDLLRPVRGRLTEISVLLAANLLATIARFFVLRFAIQRPRQAALADAATLSSFERKLR